MNIGQSMTFFNKLPVSRFEFFFIKEKEEGVAGGTVTVKFCRLKGARGESCFVCKKIQEDGNVCTVLCVPVYTYMFRSKYVGSQSKRES